MWVGGVGGQGGGGYCEKKVTINKIIFLHEMTTSSPSVFACTVYVGGGGEGYNCYQAFHLPSFLDVITWHMTVSWEKKG